MANNLRYINSKELFNVSSSVLVNNTFTYIKLFSLEGARIELLIVWFAAKLYSYLFTFQEIY